MSPPPTRPYDQQQLAAFRTRLANERTLLTYVRTSLALMGFGLALLQLGPHRAHTLGLGAVGVAVLFMLVGWLRFRYHARQIEMCRASAT
jgi:putative membrane protein